MFSPYQRGVIVDELPEQVADLHRADDERVEGLHGWIWCWQFPAGVFWPVCACGFITNDGFTSEDAAWDARCERQDRQVGGAAGAVPSL